MNKLKRDENYFTERYIKGKALGKGGFGKVYEGKDKQRDNEKVAIKIIQKEDLECEAKQSNMKIEYYLECVKEEISFLKKCESDYSVKLKDYFETDNNFYIIMELCDGDLEGYLNKQESQKIKLDEIKEIFNKLNETLQIMYDNNIVHRDLSHDNILIKKKDNKIIPFLSDYGAGKILQSGLAKTAIGKMKYMAPEILLKQIKPGHEEEKYTVKIDLYSIGVILYRSYFGDFPYDYELGGTIYRKMENGPMGECREDKKFDDLFMSLLQKDPKKRLDLDGYFKHEFWLTPEDNNMIKKIDEYNKRYAIKNNMKYDFYDRDIFIEINGDTTKEELEKFQEIKFRRPKELRVYYEQESKINLFDFIKKLQYKNLSIIDLNGNNLSNIKGINDLSFKYLTEIDLSSNKISDISILKDLQSVKLRKLNLSINQISDINVLNNKKFNELTSLILCNNEISDIKGLTKSIENENKNDYPLMNLIILNLSNNKISDVNCLTNATFLNLERLILNNNQISDLSPFKSSHFELLQELDLSYNKISDISVLDEAKFNGLKGLNLSNNKEITELKIKGKGAFSKLESFCMNHVKLGNLNIFKNIPCDNLTSLQLMNCEINDISLLGDNNGEKFKNLTSLNLSNNNISDISIFDKINFTIKKNEEKKRLEGLEILNLNNNKIKDINVFKKECYKALFILNLSSNEISDISLFKEGTFPQLFDLNLSNNKITDISALSNKNQPLFNLKFLELSDNQITDIEVLCGEEFKNLKEIYLGYNKITKLDTLYKLSFNDLASFHIENNEISLLDMPQEIDVEYNVYV